MNRERHWKARLYDAYVSSGQAGTVNTDSSVFNSRAPAISAVIKKYIPREKNTRILDLGCGHGAFLYFLKQAAYYNIFGIDLSAEQVEFARNMGISDIEQCDIGSFLASAENNSADVILLVDIIEHLNRQELFNVLDDIFRVLSPKGRCIIHVPNAEGLFGMRIRYGDLTHELSFTPKSAHQLLSTVGFRIVNCYDDRPVIHNVKSFARRVLWEVGTFFPRALLMAETGQTRFILSQNMWIIAVK